MDAQQLISPRGEPIRVRIDDSALSTASIPVTEPASRGPSWLAVLSVAVGSFAFVATEYMPVGLLPQIARDLGVTPGTAGLMVTTPGIIAAISAPVLAARRRPHQPAPDPADAGRAAARIEPDFRHCAELCGDAHRSRTARRQPRRFLDRRARRIRATGPRRAGRPCKRNDFHGHYAGDRDRRAARHVDREPELVAHVVCRNRRARRCRVGGAGRVLALARTEGRDAHGRLPGDAVALERAPQFDDGRPSVRRPFRGLYVYRAVP